MSSLPNAEFESFLTRLADVPWFAHIGEPLPSDVKVSSILDWSAWAGPEEPSVAAIALHQQALYDELMGDKPSIEWKRAWDQIHEAVTTHAKSCLPYREDRDAWFAPNAAVWQAAWTAGLVGLCIALDRHVPTEIATQWDWFLKGRWPCDWEGEFPQGTPIVF